jgi:tetratricopeptide (TPR) repeat protein
MAMTRFIFLHALCTAFTSSCLNFTLRSSQASSLSALNSFNSSSIDSNSSSATTAQIAANQITETQYTKLLRCGNTYLAKNDIEHALLFFKRAYETAKDPYGKKLLADNIGLLLYQNNQFDEAIPYLRQAKASRIQTESQINPTILLGMALFNKKNHKEAFTELSQACTSQDPLNKASAHIHLGSIYLHGLGQKQDIDKACKHFQEALLQEFVPNGIIQQRCYHSFYLAALLEIEAADKLYKEAQILPITPPQEVLKRIKQAYAQLEKARAAKKNRIDADLDVTLEDDIATTIHKLNELNNRVKINNKERKKQFKQIKESTSSANTCTTETEEKKSVAEAQILVTTATKHSDQKIATENSKKLIALLQEADEKAKSYHKKHSDARYQEAEYLYIEAMQLAKEDTETLIQISKKLDELTEMHSSQLMETISTSSEQVKEEKTKAQWILLDPYGEMAKQAEQTPALTKQLAQLQTDYLEVSNVKKLHGFTNLWRTRAGNSRIIYTVVPEYHCIGIIKIDARKNVYEVPKETRTREEFFTKQITQAISQAREAAQKQDDCKQVEALTNLLKRMNSLPCSTLPSTNNTLTPLKQA